AHHSSTSVAAARAPLFQWGRAIFGKLKTEEIMTIQRCTSALALLLFACSQQAMPPAESPEAAATEEAAPSDASAQLEAALAAQPEEAQARYAQRHPKEMLEFFGVQPGMT